MIFHVNSFGNNLTTFAILRLNNNKDENETGNNEKNGTTETGKREKDEKEDEDSEKN